MTNVSVLKPINYTGIVKWVGKLNEEKYDARVHVGLRMDEPGMCIVLNVGKKIPTT